MEFDICPSYVDWIPLHRERSSFDPRQVTLVMAMVAAAFLVLLSTTIRWDQSATVAHGSSHYYSNSA